MSRDISNLFIILCSISVLLVLGYEVSVKASSGILHVDDSNVTGPWVGTQQYPYRNITNALKHATDGDTIFVRTGTYHEHLDINLSVYLVGEDRYSTIIDGNQTAGSVVNIRSGVNNVRIESFTIRRSGSNPGDCGILIESLGNKINDNIIVDNNNGIGAFFSSHNVFSRNIIVDNNYNGIALYSCSDNMVSGNVMSNNSFDGLGLYASSYNQATGNAISNNGGRGIGLYSVSRGNVISGNTVANNSNEGIYLHSMTANNLVYHNNFNNNDQVLSESTNFWDHNGEGNYWIDYAGKDLNGDGLGDEPYFMNFQNQDNHPLMGSFSVLNVAWNEEIIHVSIISNSTISGFKFEIGIETGNKIIRFNVTDSGNMVGFFRVMIPIKLTDDPLFVVAGAEEITPVILPISNETHVCLYFTHSYSSNVVAIISSKTLGLYNELLAEHIILHTDLDDLNTTYHYLLGAYDALLGNYSSLQERYFEMNSSYHEHLLGYEQNVCNMRNLIQIFAATTAIFIITTVYLSKRANAGKIEYQ